jgi:hypothetical protein
MALRTLLRTPLDQLTPGMLAAYAGQALLPTTPDRFTLTFPRRRRHKPHAIPRPGAVTTVDLRTLTQATVAAQRW